MVTPLRRKRVAFMELVSAGSPMQFDARKGHCHRISPIPKKETTLKPSHSGVTRSLAYACDETISFTSLLKSAVKEALEEERKKQVISNDVQRELVTSVTLRSLISDWSRTSGGSAEIHKLTNAVNEAYERDTKLPHRRRVMHGDLLSELKHLVKRESKEKQELMPFLDTAQAAIEIASGLPGVELMAMMKRYVQANQQVHIKWTVEKLQSVLNMVEDNALQIEEGNTPSAWIKHMVTTIAKDRKWGLQVQDLEMH